MIITTDGEEGFALGESVTYLIGDGGRQFRRPPELARGGDGLGIFLGALFHLALARI